MKIYLAARFDLPDDPPSEIRVFQTAEERERLCAVSYEARCETKRGAVWQEYGEAELPPSSQGGGPIYSEEAFVRFHVHDVVLDIYQAEAVFSRETRAMMLRDMYAYATFHLPKLVAEYGNRIAMRIEGEGKPWFEAMP